MQDINKINQLAYDIISWAQTGLIVNLRFMDAAINALKLKTYDGKIATDSKSFFYDPFFILKKYKKEENSINANYMHSILHCVFRHYITKEIKNPKLWNLACDIAVENIIAELDIPCLEVKRHALQKKTIEEIKHKIHDMSANKIYSYYQKLELSDKEIDKIHKPFYVDEHSLWYQKKAENIDIMKVRGKQINSKQSKTLNTDGLEDLDLIRTGIEKNPGEENSDEKWANIAKKMQVDLESFSKSKSNHSPSMIQNLKAINRQKYDYTEFLKKFAVLNENIKVNDEEFDYIFYSYGLDLYGNLPLIEPLEYKEDYSIKEFVIAIDTSASVSGFLVQKFLEKTYNILKQEESFHKKINLRIIQADSEIREDVKIRSKADFDSYIKTMQLKGFGSTDFRPVFEHVDKLIKEGELNNLKGLIYFTDGYGTFPDKKPDYKSAFLFVNDDFDSPPIPIWAIKLVLESDEI